jgi:hypothetical protein
MATSIKNYNEFNKLVDSVIKEKTKEMSDLVDKAVKEQAKEMKEICVREGSPHITHGKEPVRFEDTWVLLDKYYKVCYIWNSKTVYGKLTKTKTPLQSVLEYGKVTNRNYYTRGMFARLFQSNKERIYQGIKQKLLDKINASSKL